MHSCGFFKRTRRHPQTNWAVKSSVHAAKAKTKQKKTSFTQFQELEANYVPNLYHLPRHLPPPHLCIASHTCKTRLRRGKCPLGPGGRDSVGNSEPILIWKRCSFSRCKDLDSHDTRGSIEHRFLLWYLHSVRRSWSSQLLICLWEHLPLASLVCVHLRVFTVCFGKKPHWWC